MLRYITNSILGRTLFLFFIIVFLPVCLMFYFVYGIIVENHNENISSRLKAASEHINTIFNNNAALVSGKGLKIREDQELKNIAYDVYEEKKNPAYLMDHLRKNYGFEFYMLQVRDGEKEETVFYSSVLKAEDFEYELSESGKVSLNYHNGFFTAKTRVFLYDANDTEFFMVTGRTINLHSIFEIFRIQGSDFILFREHEGIKESVFTTMYDDYGFSLPPGSIKLETKSDQSKTHSEIKYSDKKFIMKMFDLGFFPDDIVAAVVRSEDQKYLHSAQRHFTYIVLFFMFLAVVLALFIRSRILNPVTDLLGGIKNASEQISKGKPVQTLDIKFNDEIGELASEYNRMATEIAVSFSRIKYLQNYLMDIFESMPSGLVALDGNGTVRQWNENAQKFSSQKIEQGAFLWEALPELKIDKERILSLISGRKNAEIYREYADRDSRRCININVFPLVTNGVSGSVIRIDDVTDMKKKEDQLSQSQKMETIGMLAGGVAHDFNNILSGIVGVVSLLKHKISNGKDVDKGMMDDYLDIMEQSGKRAVDIVQRLLTLSKKQNVSISSVKISDVMDHVVKICSNTFDRSVRIRTINENSSVCLMADFTQMQQIVLNLAINSCHAMTVMRDTGSRWGGELTIGIIDSVPDAEIIDFVTPDFSGTYFKIIIKDEGVGMEKSDLSRIYEPFYSTKDKTIGTGLGLTIVCNVVHQYGGFIKVDSRKGHGTEFCIYLPKCDTDKTEPYLESADGVASGSGTVLVIDDELLLRELAENMLTQAGYKVLKAESGSAGIDMFKKYSREIDVILLDLVMPGINGRETFTELKNIRPDIKILMTSGFAHDSRIDEVLSMGAVGFVQKPYTLQILTKEIEKAING